ncbi:MAG: YcaO-like family protein [Devosia sp.]|nr:YcaO-like family protein [Devosia sp.]
MRTDTLGDVAGRASSYSDRICPPRETLARLRPHFPALGITRLARQTGLDVVGVPCFSAIRPNAKTLAASQGKGIDDATAMVSAVMEAAEMAIAERLVPADWTGPARALEEMGAAWFNPWRMLPFGETFDLDRAVSWVAGRGLMSGRPVLVPRDAIRFDGEAPDLPGIALSTNGLASGNTRTEAEFHALCELIERDATALWSLLPPARQKSRAVAASSFEEATVDDLAGRVRRAGLRLQLFDLTSDIGVPTVMAMVGPEVSRSYFDVAAGTGTHPVPARAALRAITEAAQSRITAIAGSRDDIATADYEHGPDDLVADLLVAHAQAPPPRGLPPGGSLGSAMAFLTGGLASAGIGEPVAVALGGDSFDISVVRALSDVLEDREANANWRPGPRAIAVLLDEAA